MPASTHHEFGRRPGTSQDASTIIFLQLRQPRRSPLFPYTTLFRSQRAAVQIDGVLGFVREVRPPVLHLRDPGVRRSEEHTSELQSHSDVVCRLLLEKKNASLKTWATSWPRFAPSAHISANSRCRET